MSMLIEAPLMTVQSATDWDLELSLVLDPAPRDALVWQHRWHSTSRVELRNIEHVAVLMSMQNEGDFAGVSWADDRSRGWAQTMRAPGGWIVELHDGTDEDFAQRVHRSDEDYPPFDPDCNEPLDGEIFSTITGASIIWSWMHGKLPEGFSRTMNHVPSGS